MVGCKDHEWAVREYFLPKYDNGKVHKILCLVFIFIGFDNNILITFMTKFVHYEFDT